MSRVKVIHMALKVPRYSPQYHRGHSQQIFIKETVWILNAS
jgi:hypothetical protein